jgi:hypothetical protein
LSAFESAVVAGRVDDAYTMMSADYRRTHDRAAFAHALAPADRRPLSLRGARVELRADADLGDGEKLPLVFEDGQWRIARDPLDFYPQRAPEEALRSFLRAIDHQRWDVVLRFVPQRYRATITAELARKHWEGERRAEMQAELADVRAHLTEPMEISGDEARLTLGERKQVKLVREDGLWKVETLR